MIKQLIIDPSRVKDDPDYPSFSKRVNSSQKMSFCPPIDVTRIKQVAKHQQVHFLFFLFD